MRRSMCVITRKKIAFLFSAMRHFAQTLRRAGWQVRYTQLTDAGNTGSITGELSRALEDEGAGSALVTEPGEYRLRAAIEDWGKDHTLAMLEDDRFVASHQEFRTWAEGRKQLRMEYFYREMRRKTGLLMDGDAPKGGQWNLDAENRKPAKGDLFMPVPRRAEPDAITEEVLRLVEDRFGDHFGALRPFWFAVTRRALWQRWRPLSKRLCRVLATTRMQCWRARSSSTIPFWPNISMPGSGAAGGVPTRGGSLSRGACAAECGRGIHSADHRLARIRAGDLLDEDAGLYRRELL